MSVNLIGLWRVEGVRLGCCMVCGELEECKIFRKGRVMCGVCVYCERRFVLDGAF